MVSIVIRVRVGVGVIVRVSILLEYQMIDIIKYSYGDINGTA